VLKKKNFALEYCAEKKIESTTVPTCSSDCQGVFGTFVATHNSHLFLKLSSSASCATSDQKKKEGKKNRHCPTEAKI